MAQRKGIAYQHREWVEKNPLRVWRRETKTPQMAVASVVGVSVFAVQTWEIGSNRPNPEHMEKLARLVGRAPEDFAHEWDSWLAARPTL